MALGGTAMGVTTSDQTSLHTDSVPNALNTNRSVYANNYSSIQNTFSLNFSENLLSISRHSNIQQRIIW